MDFETAVAELELLVQTLERDGDERALMLLELVDAIHRPALQLIVSGQLEHPIARSILAMYDLVPIDDRVQVEEALDEVRPYVESHGGQVELLEVADGVVHVRMSGACHGCAGSAITLRRGIEQSLRERYPGFREVVAHEPEQLLQIETFNGPVFDTAVPLQDLRPGQMTAVELRGHPVLLINVAGEPYAFRNACPVESARELPLQGGRLAGEVLVCPWHNCAYDARSGERVDDRPEEPGLRPLPVAVQDGVVRVAVNLA
jgi:Fe-S cluster biogenesis protein NfuA/nitrite reductase/ring-hydroxylating ferredoxin subunit